MQPWNYHMDFIFHEKFNNEEDISIYNELYDFHNAVDNNGERASFTQALNVPWTVKVGKPLYPEEF